MRYDDGPNYPSQPRTVRSHFDNKGCHIHGHPSSGGILIKRCANLVDLQHLSLPRLAASQRSPNAREEDAFCQLLKRLGASWWKDEAEFLRAFHGNDEYHYGLCDGDGDAVRDHEVANEARARRFVTFGWPADGVGVWVSRFKTVAYRPGDYKKLDFALSMEERIVVMQEFGAEFVEDVETVKELDEPWSEDVYGYYTEEEDDDTSSSSAAGSLSDL